MKVEGDNLDQVLIPKEEEEDECRTIHDHLQYFQSSNTKLLKNNRDNQRHENEGLNTLAPSKDIEHEPSLKENNHNQDDLSENLKKLIKKVETKVDKLQNPKISTKVREEKITQSLETITSCNNKTLNTNDKLLEIINLEISKLKESMKNILDFKDDKFEDLEIKWNKKETYSSANPHTFVLNNKEVEDTTQQKEILSENNKDENATNFNDVRILYFKCVSKL